MYLLLLQDSNKNNFQNRFRKMLKYQTSLLLLHRALWNLYIVHSPTNALFIKLVKV